jgi:DNA-binding transcriptional LysR family regulator
VVGRFVEQQHIRLAQQQTGQGDAAFLTAGLSVAPLYECGHLATGGGLVAAGRGLTALPELAIAALGNPSLAATRLEGPVLDRSIGVVTRAGRQPPAFLEAFLGVLQAEAGDILARFRTG